MNETRGAPRHIPSGSRAESATADALRSIRSPAALVALLALLVVACGPPRGGTPGRDMASTQPTASAQAPQNVMDVHRSTSSTDAEAAGGAGDDESGPGPNGPPAAVVPDVLGLAFRAAVHRLWRSGIGFDLVVGRESRAPLWSVIEQDPPAGSDTPSSAKINLILSVHHVRTAGVIGTVVCRPDADELDDPYCFGKLFKY